MRPTQTSIMNKSAIVVLGMGLFLAAAGLPVYAETVTTASAVHPPLVKETPGARAAARDQASITRLKTRADTEITRRVAGLTELLTKINAMKRLTADQKTTFANGMNGQITSLNTLKAKIDADTDLATLRTDVQSIVKAYRIFALYMPQVNIMAHADRMLALIDEMNAISVKLQTRIDAVKVAGKDITSMMTFMTDRASKLTDATTQANNAIAAVVSLTPDGYPGNRTAMQSAQKMLQTARQDVGAAEKDATQIRELLRAAGVQTNAKITPEPTHSAK